MRRDLRRYLALGQPVEIVYLHRDGAITQRRVKLLFVGDTHIRGYCYLRRAVRQFAIANILAVFPAVRWAG
ncbi:hypothetical protein [Calditerricola satsumensis]|uniref:WYL domain-containing protein n=1 Tax=Calditerricola satsumensis TaxID=373054 RepID=A0A8J3BDL3_9BACI|nr:hypothetical protein [Calditerricola satsumensis]GGK02824.1 hypothetical protein GCM10007043_16080 [Calditerricola satsumensis]